MKMKLNETIPYREFNKKLVILTDIFFSNTLDINEESEIINKIANIKKAIVEFGEIEVENYICEICGIEVIKDNPGTSNINGRWVHNDCVKDCPPNINFMLNKLWEKNKYKKIDIFDGDDIHCSVCGGPCDLNTEYEGSAVCKDKDCSVHKEI